MKGAQSMTRWLREPLLHFAILGGLLFSIGHEWGSEERAIRVTEERLVQFLQYQTRAPDLQTARRHLQSMNTAERDHLIDLYIREEALYRQAMDMQLAQEDPVIKKRLVQKLEFMAQDSTRPPAQPPKEALQAFFSRHRDLYRQPEQFSLTHVFIQSDAGAMARAEKVLKKLNAGKLSTADAVQLGDPFPHQHNYARQKREMLDAHFGQQFAQNLLNTTDADRERWQGPIVSPRGLHLVLFLDYEPERPAKLQEVRATVLRDFMREQKDQRFQEEIQRMVEQYAVELEL
ncbi:peptidylprolyl isomerase [Biformimicrobium ophioploci]|uniref:PpiC domain-containing protein n=1 Tax=Biformimicrobium ophioploci TaxID=3036711 RepID=A0ABQ6LX40_9GAMM|nr:peptidylprolyl isomerase [Microbulbifer sp. NKW57]GMG86638.1 hypothetical protein MNKW57_09590 [Microbulbifer sp. NKW57]